jgi:hypothetical protein
LALALRPPETPSLRCLPAETKRRESVLSSLLLDDRQDRSYRAETSKPTTFHNMGVSCGVVI